MWLREQGHVFDWGTLKWCQAYTTPPNGCYDAETVALDEFGHVEGLGHHVNYARRLGLRRTRSSRPSRGPSRRPAGTCTRLQSLRRRTLQLQYDMLTTTAKYSTCLDLATVLTLTRLADPVLTAARRP